MLWAQLPVLGLRGDVHTLRLWSYFKLQSCSWWVFHASSSILDPACLLLVMHKGSLNEGLFPKLWRTNRGKLWRR